MDREQVISISSGEFSLLMGRESREEAIQILRRPSPEDEIDRIGDRLVQRMMEAGVVEQG